MVPSAEESIKEIQAFLKKLVSSKQQLLLKLSLNAVGIDINTFNSLIEKVKTPGSGVEIGVGAVDSYRLASEIADFIRRPLQVEIFCKALGITNPNTTLLEAMQDTALLKLHMAAHCLENFQQDLSETLRYRTLLLSKKRQLQKKTKWGEIDLRDWGELLYEFAAEKTIIGKMEQDVFEDMPPAIINLFKEIGCVYGFNIVMLAIAGDVRFMESVLGIQVEADTGDLSGADYELLLKDKIETAFPNIIVELTPATGDHGADLIVSTPTQRIAIQAKRLSTPVGNAAVQEVFAAMQFYDANIGIVVTNSTYTSAAKALASKTGVILANTEDIVDLISEVQS